MELLDGVQAVLKNFWISDLVRGAGGDHSVVRSAKVNGFFHVHQPGSYLQRHRSCKSVLDVCRFIDGQLVYQTLAQLPDVVFLAVRQGFSIADVFGD